VSAQLRRCLVLDPNGTIYPGSDGDYRSFGNEALALDMGFPWVKFWAVWPVIQPLPPSQVPFDRLGTSSNPGLRHLQALDAQVARARAASPPRNVIICAWQFPTWANGTSQLKWNTAQEVEFAPQDRMTRTEWNKWVASGKTDFSVKRKELIYRIPDDVSPTSAYASWIRFLINRYRSYGPSVAIEVMNEPGLQMWPQMGPSTTTDPFAAGPVTMGGKVARMMQSAQVASAAYGHPLLLMGPACDDGPRGNNPVPGSTRQRTMYATAAKSTLDGLDAVGFKAHNRFAWSHHNYTDVEQDQGADVGVRNRAAHVRSLLVGRWSGWPQNGLTSTSPGLFVTEGGARVDVVGSLARQADLIKRNWGRMAGDTGDGAGIAMLAQYLSYSAPYFDTGVCEPSSIGGAKRPAYTTWKSLPTFF
jgi:hypothetical protein